jgi:hypothetical protein
MDRDVAEIKQRIEALNKILAHYAPPASAEHATDFRAHEAEFWAARLEERQLLQAQLDSLLQRKAG